MTAGEGYGGGWVPPDRLPEGYPPAGPLIGVVFGFLLGPVAIAFSAVGLRREPRGMATAGLILGIMTIVLKSIPGYHLL